jgi:hypothetical protein
MQKVFSIRYKDSAIHNKIWPCLKSRFAANTEGPPAPQGPSDRAAQIGFQTEPETPGCVIASTWDPPFLDRIDAQHA